MEDDVLQRLEKIYLATREEFQKIPLDLLERSGVYKNRNGWSMSYPSTVFLDGFDDPGRVVIPDVISNLYVSLPFCSRQCTFCTIISGVDNRRREEYFKALFAEMEFYKRQKRPKVRYIDLGGGSVSFLTPEELDSLMCKIEECFELPENPEVCLEAHPELARQGNRHDLLRVARKHKIPNISFGVQTFDDALLERLNRGHTVGDVKESARIAKQFLPSFSIDLLGGIEGQTKESLFTTLAETIRLKPGSIDFYTYINSHNSIESSADNANSLFTVLFVLNSLVSFGWFPHRLCSDVVIFKRPDENDNINDVIRGLGPFGKLEMIGLGSGAFSFSSRFHSANPYDIPKYISNVKENGLGFSLYSENSAEAYFCNFVKDSIRRYCRLNFNTVRKIFGIDFRREYSTVIERLASLGLIKMGPSGNGFRLTKLGFIYDDKVISFFFPAKYFEDYFALEEKVNSSHLKEFHEEICNSPFNFELTPEIHSFIRKQRS